MACLLSLASVVAAQAESTAPRHVTFANGIEATLYSPEYIRERMTAEQDGETLFLVDNLRYHFITDVDDPSIANRGDGRFHPMSMQIVEEALREIRLPHVGVRVRVFVLPFPRREVIESSARPGMIFLSPGAREVSEYAIHFTVAHEIGHIYQYRHMPDHDVYGWSRYSDMRDIHNRAVYHAGAIHKNRPHEVFAEDFRFLFGSAAANYSGSIENDELELPSDVDGLHDYMLSLSTPKTTAAVQIVPTPNPFNPNTEIQVEFSRAPEAQTVQVRVFDAHGRMVRQLFNGRPQSQRLRLRWDGRGTIGEALPSGVYFARLDLAGERYTAKLMLVK